MEFIFDTSGTTGAAKKVVLSEAALLAQAETDVYDLGVTCDSVVNMDRWSIGGYRKLFWARLTGCRLAFYPGEEKIDMRDWIIAVGITHLNLLATTFRWLCMGKHCFPSVEVLEVGGEMVDWGDVALARERFPGAIFFNRYGCSETNLICRKCVEPKEAVGKGRLPVGMPLKGVKVKIIDGEIVVESSPYMASGYYNNHELTKVKFRENGYHTGDLGYFLPNGELMHMGRRALQIIGEAFDNSDRLREIRRLSAMHGGEVK